MNFQPTLGAFIAIHVFFFLIVVFNWRKYVKEPSCRDRNPIFTLSLFLFLLFAVDGGDYFHYQYYVVNGDYEPFEPVYKYIGDFVNNRYIPFRMIVWGGALLLFRETLKRFNLDINRTTFFLFVVFISVFDYARASLAMAIFCYGLSFLLVPSHNKLVSRLLGVGLMLLSIYFHNSMLVACIASIALVLPVNKRTILIIAATFILSGTLLNSIYSNFLSIDFSESINGRLETYSNQEYDNLFSIYEWIRRYIEYSVFFISYIIVAVKFYFTNNTIPNEFRFLSKIALSILLMSIGVLLIPNMTFVLFYRFLYLAMIPLIILFCYCEQSQLITNKTYLMIIFLGLLYLTFGFVKRIIGGNFA